MDLLIFDLDGTLIDSKLDLANAVNATLAARGLSRLPNELVYSYVGDGAPTLIRRALGPQSTDTDVAAALEFFIGYYGEHMLENTCLYEGVRESLDRFRKAGKAMAVLTNKPVRISRALVEGLGLGEHFFAVYGGDSFPEKKPHPMGIERLVEESGIGKDRALMIGDSAVDVLTARNADIPVYGVTYGFQPESLEREVPDKLAGRMEDVADLVLNG